MRKTRCVSIQKGLIYVCLLTVPNILKSIKTLRGMYDQISNVCNLTNFFPCRRCLQICSKQPNKTCPNENSTNSSVIFRAVQHVMLSLPKINIDKNVPILNLTNFDLKGLPINKTDFQITSDQFYFHKDTGKLFVKKVNLKKEKIYQVDVNSNAFDSNGNVVSKGKFIIHFYCF